MSSEFTPELLALAANEADVSSNAPPSGLRFGDIISNGWAGNRNPTKLFMYVRTDKHIEGISLNGKRVQLIKQENRAALVLRRETPDLWRVWAELANALGMLPDVPLPQAQS